MSDDLKPCPDCGAEVGTPHEGGCDVARCLWTGGQMLQCDGHPPVVHLLDAIDRNDWDCVDRTDASAEIKKLAVEVREWFGDSLHDCGEDVWTGQWPGEAECFEFGWYSYFGPPWVQCGPDHPGAGADLNRLMIEAVWDRERVRWVKRT